jgi:nicotinate-nucleotide adenylyltransferase
MRIAFFGGTFDPPHLGHLRIALAAAERLQLDRVLFAPVAVQPLKSSPQTQPQASFADRLAMLQLLLDEVHDPRLEVSSLDAALPDGRPNYTYETVLRLRSAIASDDSLFVLTGADSLLTLHQWHRALDLVLAVDFIVAARPGFPFDRLTKELLPFVTPSELRPGSLQQSDVQHLILVPGAAPHLRRGDYYYNESKANFYLLPDIDEDISSTAIRAALNANPQAALPKLAPSVSAYIEAHALYRWPRPQANIEE